MRKVLIFINTKAYEEIGPKKVDEVIEACGVSIMNDTRTVLKWQRVYEAFRTYDMHVAVMEGTIPDDRSMHELEARLEFYLGIGIRPIIFIYRLGKEEEE